MKDKISILRELASIIDKDIKVYEGNNNECFIDEKIIYVSFEYDIEAYLIHYMTIDLGFNYIEYCSSRLYWFIHELGHMVNGWLYKDYYSLVVTALKDNNDSLYNNLYNYIRLDDELYANEWAMDFIMNNIEYIKRIDREILK